MRRPLSAAILLLLGALLIAGCATATPPVSSPAAAAPTTAAATELPVYTLDAPALNLNAVPLAPMGLNLDGSLQVPDVHTPKVAGWFSLGVKPGDVGPAVVMGHVSGRPEGATASVPGIFTRLSWLKAGDRVAIRSAADVLVFEVYRSDLVSKDAFPTESVYGDTPGAELRLITCDGVLNQVEHSYESNRIVFARLVTPASTTT